MEYKRFNNKLVIRLDPGDEIVSCIEEVGKKEAIALAGVSGIGAVGDITIGVFDVAKKVYFKNDFKGAFEIVSLAGNISKMNGETYVHLHMSVGDGEGKVFGGHLNRAIVSATAEIILDILEGEVDREFSEQIGLNIIKFV